MITRRRMLTIGAWVVVAVVAVVLSVQRYRDAVSQGQPDLGEFFLPAARAIVAGGSPYTVDGYFYSPLVALLLAPAAGGDGVVYWTVLRIVAGIAACVIAAIAFLPRGSWGFRAVVAAVAVVTLMWSWPTTISLWLGQVELFVLFFLALTALLDARGHRYATGLALGATALIKTWPALFLVWLLRRGWRGRGREWLGALTMGAVAVALALLVGGPAAFVAMVSGPLAGSAQDLAANSVWGVARIVFSDSPMATGLVVSPPLRWITSVVLAVLVVLLLAVVLVRPGPAAVALFNTVMLVILLLPVSHFFYAILALPALWWWAGRVLTHPRSVPAWIALAALAAWWVVVFRLAPAGDGLLATSWQSIVIMFATTLIAAAVSVVCAATLEQTEEAQPAGADEVGSADLRAP